MQWQEGGVHQMGFEGRCEEMGIDNLGHGCYFYSDIYGDVLYRKLRTLDGSGLEDNVEIPNMALFTKGFNEPNDNFLYCGIVSDKYKFMGNNVINQQLRNSINEVGSPILRENCLLSVDKTQMYNEMVIRNSVVVSRVGDVYPTLVSRNSYNGHRAASISFGLCMVENQKLTSFSFKLGEMTQIHVAGSQTSLTASVGDYVNTFSQSIVELAQNSFNYLLTEEDVMSTLDLVEKVGKKRRSEISSILTSITESDDGYNNQRVSAFNLFLAITRYSSLETNLNAKSLLENIAERVLVVPDRMRNMLERLQT